MTRRLLLLVLALVLLSGCKVTEDAILTVKTQAAGNDRYHELVGKALKGETDLERDGIAPVTTAELAETPPAVRGLVSRLLEALHANRFAAHSTLFQLNEGPDPDQLLLKPVALPAIKDEDDELLEDD